MADHELAQDRLTDLFAAARRDRAELPAGLMDRMLADAAQVQAGFAAPPVSPRRTGAAPGALRRVLAALGGWPAMGGLAASCAAGVWLGIAPPDFLPDPVELVLQSQSDVDVLESYSLSALLPEDG